MMVCLCTCAHRLLTVLLKQIWVAYRRTGDVGACPPAVGGRQLRRRCWGPPVSRAAPPHPTDFHARRGAPPDHAQRAPPGQLAGQDMVSAVLCTWSCRAKLCCGYCNDQVLQEHMCSTLAASLLQVFLAMLLCGCEVRWGECDGAQVAMPTVQAVQNTSNCQHTVPAGCWWRRRTTDSSSAL
jgi:hypothetical protein